MVLRFDRVIKFNRVSNKRIKSKLTRTNKSFLKSLGFRVLV